MHRGTLPKWKSRSKKIALALIAILVSIGCCTQINTEAAEDNAYVPEHHKFIQYNQEKDDYTITLNVKGMREEQEGEKPKVDVLLILDASGSMASKMDGSTRIEVLQNIITKEGGLSDLILNNDKIDGQMAAVKYSGDVDWDRYNDASEVQGWTNSNNDFVSSIKNGLVAKGGTNCQAGLITGLKTMDSARAEAQKYVIFMSDGVPTYYYDKRGYTEGKGYELDRTAMEKAYEAAKNFTGLTAFYSIGISSDASPEFLQQLITKQNAPSSGYFPSNNTKELEAAFTSIAASITKITCRDVTITDKLSPYVNFVGDSVGDSNLKIQAFDKNNNPQVLPDGAIVVSNTDGTIQAQFADGYELEKDWTYAISFDVKASQLAYDEYATNGYLHTGSEGSDAPGNATSTNKQGFYSNDFNNDTGATLTYKYGSEDAQFKTVPYVEQPVVQVKNMQIPVEKIWLDAAGNNITKEISQEVVVHLIKIDGGEEQDTGKNLTLNQGNNWRGTFENVAKGHQYTVKEDEVSGFVISIAGNSESGFSVTNRKNPSLTVKKTVTGSMGDLTKKFPFVITLKNEENEPITGDFAGIRNDSETINLHFENGILKTKLGHQDVIKIENLPFNAKYSVVEDLTDEEYKYEISYKDNDSKLDKDKIVEVTNNLERKDVPVTGIDGGNEIILGGVLSLLVLIGGLVMFVAIKSYKRHSK